MKVVFLDMDGVVNSADWFEAGSHNAYRRARGKAKAAAREKWNQGHVGRPYEQFVAMIDPAAVKLLNRIAHETGCKFVLSSSWRIPWPWEAVAEMLEERGFDGALIGATPNGCFLPEGTDDYARGYEIQAWLDEHPEVRGFVIVDDGSDMAHLKPRLVQTSWKSGMDEQHAVAMIRLLNEEATGTARGKGDDRG